MYKSRKNNRTYNTKKKLKKLLGEKIHCKGRIDSITPKAIGLANVVINKRIQVQHIWLLESDFKDSSQVFDKFCKHTKIQFNGIVYQYERKNHTISYSINEIHNIILEE